MLTVIGIALFAFGAFCLLAGIGHLVARALVPDNGSARRDWTTEFWFGFGGLLAALLLWHFFLPIDFRAALFFGTVGVAGFISKIRRGDRIRSELEHPATWVACLSLLGAMLILAVVVPKNFDSGYYHFNSVRWANEHPIVPGLANLFASLGFNQSGFLYLALLNELGPGRHGHNVGNLLLFAVVGIELVCACVRALRETRVPDASLLFPVTVLPLFALAIDGSWSIAGRNMSSPAPDAMVYALSVAIFSRFVSFMRAGGDERESTSDLILLIVLVPAAVTIKVSFAVLGAGILAISLFTYFRRMPADTWKSLFPAMLFASGLGVMWVAGNVILSGYPVYPLPIGRVAMDWAQPPEFARIGHRLITAGTRLHGVDPDIVLSSNAWLGPWSRRVLRTPDVVTPVLAFGAGLLMTFLVSMVARRKASWGAWLPLLPLVAALVHWFTSAPDPRFAAGMFLCLGGWSLAVCCAQLLSLTPKPMCRILAGAALAAAALLPLKEWIVSGGEVDGVSTIPKARMYRFRTNSGLEILLPYAHFSPWDSPLPAAPIGEPRLELRGADLSTGFRIGPPKADGMQ